MMVVTVDFTTTGADLTYVGPTVLTEIIPGTRFRTPDRFVETTLCVYHNGLPLHKDNADGWTLVDDQTFTLKEPLTQPASWLMVSYIKKA